MLLQIPNSDTTFTSIFPVFAPFARVQGATKSEPYKFKPGTFDAYYLLYLIMCTKYQNKTSIMVSGAYTEIIYILNKLINNIEDGNKGGCGELLLVKGQ